MPDSFRWAAIDMLVGGVLGLVIAAAIYEFAHVLMYARFGCSSTVRLLSDGLLARVSPASGCAADPAALSQAQVMVEAVGYHVVPMGVVLGAIVGCLWAAER